MPLDGGKRRAQLMAHGGEQRRLELIHLMLARHVAQQESAPNGMSCLVRDIEQAQRNGAAMCVGPDLDGPACVVSCLSPPARLVIVLGARRGLAQDLMDGGH